MKKQLVSSVAAAALFLPALAFACPGAGGAQHACAGKAKAAGQTCTPGADGQLAWRAISVPLLATLLEQDHPITVVDAHTSKTRTKFGVIPGATLIGSPKSFDLTSLPAEKGELVVFYCANQRCTASHKAADRALESGWRNVFVLPVGIKGWADAGQTTEPLGRT